MDYRREIDGLRALAVLPVIMFHAGFELFSGGFVGVDIFFVISGYLITTIILSELEQGKFSIVNFYERRARRILPALFLVIFISIPFAWLWLLPSDMQDFSQSLVAVSIFSSNILFWRESGYFDAANELKPLLHTWSLAVEEQFYVLFPLFLILFWKLGRLWILIALGLVFAGSFSVAQWAAYAKPAAAFYLLPTRSWELLVGAFAAFYLSKVNNRDFNKLAAEAGGWIGIILILYGIFSYSRKTPFPGIYALAPTLGTVLVILFAKQNTIIGKFLGNKAFVGVGLISYSAYLWHQPIFSFARHRSITEPSHSTFLLLSVLTLFLAYLSWRFVEAPFRKKSLFTKKIVFSCTIVISLLLIVFGYYGHKTGGYKERWENSANFSGAELPRIDNGWCFYSIDSISSLKVGPDGLNCFLGDKRSKNHGILFGDSFAGHYEPLWNDAGNNTDLKIHAVTTNWCFPTSESSFTGPANSRALSQCIFNRKFFSENIADYDFAILGGSWGDVLNKEYLEGTLRLIDELSKNMKVVIVMPAPTSFDANPLDKYKQATKFGYLFNISEIGTGKDISASKANEILHERSKKYPNVIFVKRESLFKVNGINSEVTSDGIPYSLDGKHISIYGSLSASENFLSSDDFQRFRVLLDQARPN